MRNLVRGRGWFNLALSLALLSGCVSPGTPSATSDRAPTRTASSPGPTPAKSPSSSSTSPSGLLPTPGILPVDGGGAVPAGQPPLALPAPIDPSKVLVGRVLVPDGIISNNGGSVIGNNGANVIGNNGANVIGNNGANLISDNGAAVIGQNGANVVGQNGANVIGQNGANVIGQNGANIISNNGGSFRLNQRPLAYASLRLVDAAGKPRLDLTGNEIMAQSDGSGQYLLPREAINENSILEVTSPYVTGTLRAFVPRSGGADVVRDVDAVSTISASYVLETFVKGNQGILERLTPDLESEAQTKLASAIESEKRSIASVEASAVSLLVNELRAKLPDIEDVVERIKRKLIIVGVENGGDGLPATSVHLNSEIAGLGWFEDHLYIFMPFEHLLQVVSSDGKLHNVVTDEAWPYQPRTDIGLASHVGMAFRDGWLYLSDERSSRIVRIKDGVVEVIAGTGEWGCSPDGTQAKETMLRSPSGLAFDPQGALYYADSSCDLVRRIRIDGTIETVVGGGTTAVANSSTPGLSVKLSTPTALALSPAGKLLIADSGTPCIREFDPVQGVVRDILRDDSVRKITGIVNLGEKIVALAETNKAGIWANSFLVIEDSGFAAIPPKYLNDRMDFTRLPATICTDGERILVAGNGNQVVSIDVASPDLHTVLAGAKNGSSTKTFTNASDLAVSSNGDIAVVEDAKIFKIYEDGTYSHIAGEGIDGKVVKAAPDAKVVNLSSISSVAFDTDGSILATTSNPSIIRKITSSGVLTTVASRGGGGSDKAPNGMATEFSFLSPRQTLRSNSGTLLVFSNKFVSEIDSAGYIRNLSNWEPKHEPDEVTEFNGSYYYYDRWTRSVYSNNSGVTELVISDEDMRNSVSTYLRQAYTIADVAVDKNGRLYIATHDEVLRFSPPNKSAQPIAGSRGVIFNKQTRDNSIFDLQKIAFHPNGDLILLEKSQVKRIPHQLLED